MDWKPAQGNKVEPLVGSVGVLTVRDEDRPYYVVQNGLGEPIPAEIDNLSVEELKAVIKHKRKNNQHLVPAKDVQDGHFFRKRTGTTPYVRLTESSVRFLKLNPDKVYGVTSYGNVTVMEPDKLVVALGEVNHETDEEWDYEQLD